MHLKIFPGWRFSILCAGLLGLALPDLSGRAQTPAGTPDGPYQITNPVKFISPGRFNFIYADSEGRRFYIPRGDTVAVLDLDTLQQIGNIPNTHRACGIAIDPVSHQAFACGKPVAIWDAVTSQPIKDVDVDGTPNYIVFDSLTERIFVLSGPTPVVTKPAVPAATDPAAAGASVPAASVPSPEASAPIPSSTVLDGKDGSIVGTIDLGGLPEQAVSDGQGHLYVDLRDKDSVAVVDVKSLKVTATFGLGGKGSQPCALALDAKNGILFVYCIGSSNVVILDAATGNILQTLPTGHSVQAAGFNPNTMEAFSSQGEGSLTIVKENSPTDFVVEQTVKTFPHARTCTLDAKTNRILLVAPEHLDYPASADWPFATSAADALALETETPATPPPAAGGAENSGATNAPVAAAPIVHRGLVLLHVLVVAR